MIEIEIPWSNWRVSTPIENDVWGFDVVMDDQDDTGTRIYTAWSNEDGESLNNPDGWGDIVFAESSSTCSPADTSGDSVVDMIELMNYIGRWKSGEVDMISLMEAIGIWKGGGC